MIDVHMLLTGNEDQDLLARCLQSLKDEPITLHLVKVTPGNIAKSRIEGLSRGRHNLVGWVDPDDVIVPGSYAKLAAAIGDAPMAWMNELEQMFAPDGKTVIRESVREQPHHMHVIKRDSINWGHLQRQTRMTISNHDSWPQGLRHLAVHIPEIGYIWRNWVGSESLQLKKRLLEEQGRRNVHIRGYQLT